MDKRERVQRQFREQGRVIRELQKQPGMWWSASKLRRPSDWAGKGQMAGYLNGVPGVLRREVGETVEWCWDPNVPVTNGIVVEGEQRTDV